MKAESKRPGRGKHTFGRAEGQGLHRQLRQPIMAFFKGIVPFITTHLKKSRRGRHI